METLKVWWLLFCSRWKSSSARYRARTAQTVRQRPLNADVARMGFSFSFFVCLFLLQTTLFISILKLFFNNMYFCINAIVCKWLCMYIIKTPENKLVLVDTILSCSFLMHLTDVSGDNSRKASASQDCPAGVSNVHGRCFSLLFWTAQLYQVPSMGLNF